MSATRPGQTRVLPFACPTCPYRASGRCDGPSDNKTYLMQDPSLVSCIDVERRGPFYEELHARVIPVPRSSYQGQIRLPPFIPAVKSGLSLAGFSPDTLFAVTFKEVLGRGGELVVDDLNELRRRMGMPPGARVALVGIAQDDQMEALWHAAPRDHVWERIASMGFEFVTSTTFSVWDETPRFDQVRNQERNLQNHDLLANLGVPTIPFLFPVDDSDYRATWEWLAERRDINTVAVLARYYRSRRQFAEFIKSLRKLQSGAGRPLKFLVAGAAKLGKLTQIFGEFDASVVTGKPFHAALGGMRTTENLHHPADDLLRHSMSREELVTQNIERYRRRCEELSHDLYSAA